MAKGGPKKKPAQEAHRRFQMTWIAFKCVLPIIAIVVVWVIDVRFNHYPDIPALLQKLKEHNEALIYDSSYLRTIYRTFVDGSLMLYSALLFVSIHIELSISKRYKKVMDITHALSIIALLFAFLAFMGFVFLKIDIVLARTKPEQNMLVWFVASILSVLAAFGLSWAAFWHFSPYSGQASAGSTA